MAAPILDAAGWKCHISDCPSYPQAVIVAKIIAARGLSKSAVTSVPPIYLREPGVGPVNHRPADM
jgi:hypothetical protein